MSEPWKDILIKKRDIVLDLVGLPQKIQNRDTIAQDMAHMIIERGFLVELIAEHSNDVWRAQLQRIIEAIEEDVRIIPGATKLYKENDYIIINAQTILGTISHYVPFITEAIYE